MKFEELFNEAMERADKYYKGARPGLFTDLMTDLKAFGRTEDEILEEFITEAYMTGYCHALQKQCEDYGKGITEPKL